MSDKSAFITRAATAYARYIVTNPGKVVLLLLALGAVSTWLALHLELESDQLSLISQDLPEVKEVKRVTDMVGGAGYLQLGLREGDEETLKRVSDKLVEKLTQAKQPDGTPWVRFITYKVPIEFVQENMVLFIKTEDLIEARRRITLFLKDQLRRNNPFFMELRKTEPVKLELDDLIARYSSVGSKSIRDSYYISDDKQMMMVLIKPNWGATELNKTHEFLEYLSGGAKVGEKPTKGFYAELSKEVGLELIEDYATLGDKKTVYFGYTGTYKTSVDDSLAVQKSIGDVGLVAFLFIVVITVLFFRKVAPTIIVISGMALGTVLTLGFAKLALGELNMVTSMIAAILMGFGVDYGIHFVYRTRIELGFGRPYDEAITQAIINAGRPALIAAIVTSGSFFVLLVSGFRGFSQFGFLAGFGTLIIGFTLFAWSPAILALIGRRRPELVKQLIGEMKPPSDAIVTGKTRIPKPKLVLAGCLMVVAMVCAFSIPWTGKELPKDRPATMLERLGAGVTFNYNTRALVPVDYPSIRMADEINRRFKISSDPVAVRTDTLEEAKELWYTLTKNPETEFNPDRARFSHVGQVVSLFSFVPPPKTAAANAKVLEEWKEELKDLSVESLPPELQDKAAFFMKVLGKRPFDVTGVPELYAANFRNLPTAKPENKGYLTFIYPTVDMWDGANLMIFADQIGVIKAASGKEYRSAGLAILYAKLARIVLFDGKLTVLLAALWILFMHYLDFRSVKLAAASVIPLGVGLWMLLGVLSITDHKLNFMNLVILPILLGFGVSHGLYLLHRFLEGTSPLVALRSVGAAVASSTLTAVAGFASLFFAQHAGLQSIGYVACIGLLTTLLVSFTVLAAVLQLIHDKDGTQVLGEQRAQAPVPAPAPTATS